MKFEINTSAKIVTLLGAVTFTELETIKKFIGDEWKKWSIEAETEVVFRERLIPYQPYRPYWYKEYFINPIWQVPNIPNKYVIECKNNNLSYNLAKLQQ